MTQLLNMNSLLSASKPITDLMFKNLKQKFELINTNKSVVISSVRNYRFNINMSENEITTQPIEPFRPKTALILAKFSRYEFEKRRNPYLTESDLIKNVIIIAFYNKF
jgi:hypothetical protein